MNSGELIHYAVSAASAVICLYIRSELSKQRTEINEEIGKLRVELFKMDRDTRQWAWTSFKSRGQSQDCIGE